MNGSPWVMLPMSRQEPRFLCMSLCYSHSATSAILCLVQETKAKADELKGTWAHPVKPYGYWNSDKNNHKLLLDMRLSNLSGRQDPYEVVLKDK